jgi:hypothetical protein
MNILSYHHNAITILLLHSSMGVLQLSSQSPLTLKAEGSWFKKTNASPTRKHRAEFVFVLNGDGEADFIVVMIAAALPGFPPSTPDACRAGARATAWICAAVFSRARIPKTH